MRKAKRGDGYDAADYLATMTAELAEMAAVEGWDTLAEVLDIARLEAEQLREHPHQMVVIDEPDVLLDDRSAVANGYGED
jgi:hypothetical protein